MLKVIFPSYANIPNRLLESAGITTQGMVSYLIYFIQQFPFLFIPTHKLQKMFLAKSILLPPMAMAMTIWIPLKAGPSSDFFPAPAKVHGTERAWLFLSSMISVTGSFSTIAVNIPDFSRFSKKPRSQVWQLPFIPLFKITVGICGIVSAGTASQLYGKPLWNPLQIVDHWQDSSSGRAAAFFCAALWCLAQICVNISANSISFANDITALVPKWFNIRRGSVFCAIMGG
jgi:nucleobase:cation symporter-1, NCS1 family